MINPYSREYEWDMECRDYNNMKEMYPYEVKQLCELVEEECRSFEYAGSFIYDAYPDRLTLNRMIDRIKGRVIDCKIPDKYLRQMIEIILYNEILRCRNCGRKYRKLWNFRL